MDLEGFTKQLKAEHMAFEEAANLCRVYRNKIRRLDKLVYTQFGIIALLIASEIVRAVKCRTKK